MVKTSVGNAGYGIGSRDSVLASLLSLVPGLGQIYNRQARKGLLFLATTASYLLVFSLIVFNQGLIDCLNNFGQSFHMKPDSDLIAVLRELHAGSTVSFIVSALFLGFVIYAIKDAYQFANHLHNRYIYTDYSMEMTEAASGSYLLHFVGITVLFLLAMFYLQHSRSKTQITYIEFVQDQIPTQKIVQSKRVSAKTSEDSGLHRNQPIAIPSHHSAATAVMLKTFSQPLPQFHPVMSPTRISTLTPKQLVSYMIPNRLPIPAVTTPNHPITAPPTVSQINNQTKSLVPQPSLSEKHHSAQAILPALANNPSKLIGSSMPVPTSASASNSEKFMPTPVSGDKSLPGKNNSSGLPMGIAPIPAGGLNSHAPAVAVLPVMPSFNGTQGTPGVATSGNPIANSNIRAPENISSQRELGPVDFTAYMDDLTRRIKRAWFPPRHAENLKVQVIFKIHKGGQLSDLRLSKSCGLAAADDAALKAIENAAPFRQLPNRAGDNVDILFTFDYTVFSGIGALRKF